MTGAKPAGASEPAPEPMPPDGRNTEPGNGNGQKDGTGVLPLLSGEDDPRAWGDRPEDTSDWLREQGPPHWG